MKRSRSLTTESNSTSASSKNAIDRSNISAQHAERQDKMAALKLKQRTEEGREKSLVATRDKLKLTQRAEKLKGYSSSSLEGSSPSKSDDGKGCAGVQRTNNSWSGASLVAGCESLKALRLAKGRAKLLNNADSVTNGSNTSRNLIAAKKEDVTVKRELSDEEKSDNSLVATRDKLKLKQRTEQLKSQPVKPMAKKSAPPKRKYINLSTMGMNVEQPSAAATPSPSASPRTSGFTEAKARVTTNFKPAPKVQPAVVPKLDQTTPKPNTVHRS